MYPNKAETEKDIWNIFDNWRNAWHKQNSVESMLRDMAEECYRIETGRYTLRDLLEIPKEQLLIREVENLLNQPSRTCTIDHIIHLFDYQLAKDYSWNIQDFFENYIKLNGRVIEEINDELPDFMYETASDLTPYPSEEVPGRYFITDYLAHGGPNCSITWELQYHKEHPNPKLKDEDYIEITDIRMNYNWWSPNKTISLIDESDAHSIYEDHLEDWAYISIRNQEKERNIA